MIYLLYGSDTDKSREKLIELVQKMVAKKPDASHVRVNDENFETVSLDELIGGMGLFSSKMIVEADQLFEDKNYKEILSDRMKEIAESENIFIFREAELLKSELKLFEKHAEKVQEFALKAVEKKRDNSFFALADAFGKRDRKELWLLYTKARMNDAVPEELHGILFWQLKSMLLSEAASDAKEAGLNPFVYQKSKQFARNFTSQELKTISSRMISIYHDARRGGMELGLALEQFILEV
jgi:DNA polymerase III delta subunit